DLALLALEVEALHVDRHPLGLEPLLLEDALVEPARVGIGHVLEPLAREAQRRPRHERRRRHVGEGEQVPRLALEHDALLHGDELAHPLDERAVPEVRLPREEVDRAESRRDVLEGAGEVVGRLRQVLEHGVVRAEAPGIVAARAPVAPVALEPVLEAPVAIVVARTACGDEPPQRLLCVTEAESLVDPALAVGEVAEALVVEVVERAVRAHPREVRAQLVQVGARERAHRQLEGVPEAVLALERFPRKARRLDLELRVGEVHLAPARHAHVLDRQALAVLEAGHLHLAALDTGLRGQAPRGFLAVELALRHAIDAMVALAREVVAAQELAHTEVADALLEPHRLTRATRAPFRAASGAARGPSGAAPRRGSCARRRSATGTGSRPRAA